MREYAPFQNFQCDSLQNNRECLLAMHTRKLQRHKDGKRIMSECGSDRIKQQRKSYSRESIRRFQCWTLYIHKMYL